MSDFFETNIMTLTEENGTVIATGLSCQLDTVNLPWNNEVQGLVPTDWYDLYSNGWDSPVPERGNYFVDETSGVKYQVFSTVFQGIGTLQMRVTKYSGSTP